MQNPQKKNNVNFILKFCDIVSYNKMLNDNVNLRKIHYAQNI